MEGLEELLNAFRNIIDFFVVLFKFIASVFKGLGVALSILLQLSVKVFVWIGTLPSWLLAFAEITFIISMIYFVIGRNAGKSD